MNRQQFDWLKDKNITIKSFKGYDQWHKAKCPKCGGNLSVIFSTKGGVYVQCWSAKCEEKSATTLIYLQDVDASLNITLQILSKCYLELVYKLRPRSETVGNLWIGIGIDGDQTYIFDPDHPYQNDLTMDGDAIITSILADVDNGPLVKCMYYMYIGICLIQKIQITLYLLYI